MALKTLKELPENITKKELQAIALEWIRLMEKVEDEEVYVNNVNEFPFAEQLDDFCNYHDHYTEVKSFIRWFFDVERDKR